MKHYGQDREQILTIVVDITDKQDKLTTLKNKYWGTKRILESLKITELNKNKTTELGTPEENMLTTLE